MCYEFPAASISWLLVVEGNSGSDGECRSVNKEDNVPQLGLEYSAETR
jgi:hypothetical protein